MVAGGFVIVLARSAVRPERTLTIRTDLVGAWRQDLVCVYEAETDEWRSPELPFPHPLIRFKFLSDGAWEEGDDRTVQSTDIEDGEYRVAPDRPIRFKAQSEILVSNPALVQRLFPASREGARDFDVYVIGSGIGGGVLAHAAANGGTGETAAWDARDVLILEAGSYLFPTHVGNLPRRHRRDSTVEGRPWQLWDDFKTKRDDSLTQPGVDISEGLYFGGRSLFWGALVPQMAANEFDLWPGQVREELIDCWYGHAKDLLNAQEHPLTAYQRLVKDRLRGALPELNHEDAEMAVQRLPCRSWGIPSGLFSTADLLMEDRLREGMADRLGVNLNHQVTTLDFAETPDGQQRVTAIRTYDLVSRRERIFLVAADKPVVLAAGTLGSPVVAKRSGMDNILIGTGLTDHTTYFRKFRIPPQSPLYNPQEVSKTVSRRMSWNSRDRALNVLVELGSSLNQARILDEDLQHVSDEMLCEVVFFYEGRLEDDNHVEIAGEGTKVRPTIKVGTEPDEGLLAEVTELSDRIIRDVCKGQPLPNQPDPVMTPMGAVGHEVGTMRMGADSTSGVVDTNLKVFGFTNLYVCDLSVFPTSPAANPSLTLAALAIRLAHHLSE